MANTEIMAETTLKRAYRANNSIYGAYKTNRDVWHANKNVWRESLIKNMGCCFSAESKKLIPTALIKEFFLPKYDKIVPI